MSVMVFDLDNTLCDIGKPILNENVELLRNLENKGNTIVFCSGKPTFYLCGLVRQVGLKNPILIGENGAVIQFGVDLPPVGYYLVSKSDSREFLYGLKKEIREKFEDNIWFQPNEVCLTIFPNNKSLFKKIRSFLDSKDLEGYVVYEHVDSFDITPRDINKGNGIKCLGELLKLNFNDFIVVGDSSNDYPMFDLCKNSLGINVKDEEKVKINFKSINDALNYLLDKRL